MSQLEKSALCIDANAVVSNLNTMLAQLVGEIHVLGSAAELPETIKKIEVYRNGLLRDHNAMLGMMGLKGQIEIDGEIAALHLDR